MRLLHKLRSKWTGPRGIPLYPLTGLAATVVGLCLLLAQRQAFAQCSMCRQSAEASPAFAGAINTGILILLVPAVLVFSSVFVVAFRYLDTGGNDEEE